MTQERLLIALDIDGTILNEDETIVPATADAVSRAQAAGHEVMVATGRSWDSVEPVFDLLGLTPEFAVCANGAMTMRRTADGGYEQFHIEVFDPAPALRRIRGYLADGSYMVELPNGDRLFTRGMDGTDWNLERGTEVEFDELVKHTATRIVVVSPDLSVDEFLGVVEQMGLHQVSYSVGWTAWLDIAPQGVNKAIALERVREVLGFDLASVVAIGDGRNDIEMLTWAAQEGRGVAMGQAPADVIAVATEVTAPVLEAGVARTLNGILDAAPVPE